MLHVASIVPQNLLIRGDFSTRSQICGKRILVSSCLRLSIRLTVRMKLCFRSTDFLRFYNWRRILSMWRKLLNAENRTKIQRG